MVSMVMHHRAMAAAMAGDKSLILRDHPYFLTTTRAKFGEPPSGILQRAKFPDVQADVMAASAMSQPELAGAQAFGAVLMGYLDADGNVARLSNKYGNTIGLADNACYLHSFSPQGFIGLPRSTKGLYQLGKRGWRRCIS